MANVYCKTVGWNQMGFYMHTNGKDYFLCKQRFYRSLWNYFVGGVSINDVFTTGGKHSRAIRRVKLKLPAYIEYVEREEGVRVLNKTISKSKQRMIGQAKRRRSRLACYNWRNDCLAELN